MDAIPSASIEVFQGVRFLFRGFTATAIAVLISLSGLQATAANEITLSLDPPVLSAPADQGQKAATPPANRPAPRAQSAKVGRVGIVETAGTGIYASKSSSSRKYATVKAETPIAIVKEEGDWYGVLMVNGATGWISRDSVRMTGYDLVSTNPQPSRGSAVSRGLIGRVDGTADSLIRTALGYSGVRYVFGGTNPATGMDCSAFVRSVFSQFGVNLPRTAREQAQVGSAVPFDQLQPGDRLYFQCKNSYIDHCGIYAGNGYFVHCSASRGGVAVDTLGSEFYWRSLAAARRS